MMYTNTCVLCTHAQTDTAPALHLPIFHSFLRSGKVHDQYSSILSLANIVRHHHIQHNGAGIWYKLTKIKRDIPPLQCSIYHRGHSRAHFIDYSQRRTCDGAQNGFLALKNKNPTTHNSLKRCEHSGKPHSPGQTPPLWVDAGREADTLPLPAAGHGDLMK